MLETLLAEAADLQTETTRLRRYLHERPEIGLHLPVTQEALLDSLERRGLRGRTGTTSSSITAVIEGAHDGPTMLLRADMDALPLREDVDVAFRSKIDEAMHACGHDLHVSMLMGAASLLQARRGDLHGRVLLMFQPGEEGYHGARVMLEDGLLDGVGNVTRAFAIHATTYANVGVVACRAGAALASADTVEIVVTGRGGHASTPHLALDPIPIACEIVQALQLMVTRRVDAFDPAVVTIGRIVAGTTDNVIPETAQILGTMRAVSERTRTVVKDGIRRVAEGIASAHGATATVEIESGYPVTVNDDHVAGEVLRVAGSLVGGKRAKVMPNPTMGAEDFSYVLQQIPGAMAFLGATPKGADAGTAAPNHSNRVYFDEDCMPIGAALYAAMALDHLRA